MCFLSRGSKFLWLGLTDVEDEGIYRWMNGAPLYYTAWAGKEPNRARRENYGGVNIELKKWADLHRNRLEFAFCSTIGKLSKTMSKGKKRFHTKDYLFHRH